jgi:hypothetical protein
MIWIKRSPLAFMVASVAPVQVRHFLLHVSQTLIPWTVLDWFASAMQAKTT